MTSPFSHVPPERVAELVREERRLNRADRAVARELNRERNREPFGSLPDDEVTA